MPILDYPIFAYSAARSAFFSFEFQTLRSLSFVIPGARKLDWRIDLPTSLAARRELLALLRRDSANIRKGLYPLRVLRPESPLGHLLRLPRIMADGLSLFRRRAKGQTREFDASAREFLSELPRYYRRNFHFQSGGYLTARSAQLYEHQVEMLFSGAADAMRRLIIPPMHRAWGGVDGKGLNLLEIGAGTGRATRFVRMAFPRAKIVATDLSDPYLKEAQKKLSRFSRIDFVQADGTKLPFQDASFDGVYSVFLYHELPMSARKAILAETHRVLKPGGFVGLVDSLQTGEKKVFDRLLARFPESYHEPFYRDYIARPMEELLKAQDFRHVGASHGFFSKACWGTRSR